MIVNADLESPSSSTDTYTYPNLSKVSERMYDRSKYPYRRTLHNSKCRVIHTEKSKGIPSM